MKFEVGEIARYDYGPSALFKITNISQNHGRVGWTRYYGRQYYGMVMGAYENDMTKATPEEVQRFKTDTHIGRLRDYPELAE